MKISNRDVAWSYFAQFFSIASGFLTLPLILHLLTTEEIAMNYLMLTVGTMVALLDFGFAPQFGRTITYVFSGAQNIYKEGIKVEKDKPINYRLLKSVIVVAKEVYLYLSLIILVIMLTLGTWYIYEVTNGFTNVNHSLLIWIVYTLSIYFTIYYKYYDSLLIGRGRVAENKKAVLASRILYIFLAYVLLLCGMGLIGVVIAHLISPFLSRYMSHKYFYDKELKYAIKDFSIGKEERKQLFSSIWYNAKKLGVNFVGAYAILKFSIFIAGLYLPMGDIASLGLMMQLASILMVVSWTFNSTINPQLSSYRISGDKQMIVKRYGMGQVIYFLVYIIGSVFLMVFGPWCLELIGAKASLPATSILALYLLVIMLEGNHGMAHTLISTANTVPYVKASIITGIIICVLDCAVLHFSTLGVFGLVLVQCLCQLSYNNWRWPKWVCDDLQLSYIRLLRIGFIETMKFGKGYAKKYI